jgi:NADH:ubiquinone oxidoreductase subunit 5 (subunit L)/multisubunit Na+/H+ antiporter MnhA subunit
MSIDQLLVVIVFLPFVASALALLLGRRLGRSTGGLMVVAAMISFTGALYVAVQGGGAFERPWIDGLNINLALRGDNFGLFFAMLVAGIGTLVGIYSCAYIPKLEPARIGRYYAALIAFMGAMLGVSLSDDMILLFVFWEITSITSFILIGFWYEREEGRKGANTALQVTALGGLAMMVGFVMVGVITGTFSISALQESDALRQTLTTSPLFTAALLLILAGAFTKSAQWPFHFWLPNAMVAPTPVSTYLHAATMVKAGIFLLGRMLPIFGSNELWTPIVATVGGITFALASYHALMETDLKAILARTTLAILGLVTMLYGLKLADQDVLQIFSHGAYKGALFLVVGIVEHATHTRDIRELRGLRHKMPITFVLLILASLSMAGLPPFFGFLAKEALYAGLLENQQWFVIAVSVVSNAFIFAVSWKLIIDLFCGEPSEKASHAHEAGFWLWMPPAVLAGIATVMGLISHTTGELVNHLSSDTHAHVHVALIPDLHHPGPLILSLTTITLGIVVFKARHRINAVQAKLDVVAPMQKVWDLGIAAVTAAAVGYSQRWQNGSLRWYFTMIWLFTVGLATWALMHFGLSLNDVTISTATMQWYGVGVCALLAVAGMTVVRSKTRLGAAIAMTATGFLTALLFLVYRSPDIVLTQILIETVSTIFILLILLYMPAWTPDRLSPSVKLMNVFTAVVVGVLMFVFVLMVTSEQFRQPDNLAADYLTRALGDAGGANAVNVIIVDFRATDTTGEIAVLVLVGLLVYGMLRSRRRKVTHDG